jgi:hypothetical protein
MISPLGLAASALLLGRPGVVPGAPITKKMITGPVSGREGEVFLHGEWAGGGCTHGHCVRDTHRVGDASGCVLLRLLGVGPLENGIALKSSEQQTF